jgi:hypothetical protein
MSPTEGLFGMQFLEICICIHLMKIPSFEPVEYYAREVKEIQLITRL